MGSHASTLNQNDYFVIIEKENNYPQILMLSTKREKMSVFGTKYKILKCYHKTNKGLLTTLKLMSYFTGENTHNRYRFKF